MEDYIDRIEKFLRGQMSQEEEDTFKETVKLNGQLCLSALIVVIILKFF